MDKLRGMETFIAVVECGSFTGAASRLGLSAVMVGKYIAQLESQLATRLLERNTRRQSLTDAGRVYFDEAKRVMEQVSIAESAVERLRLAPAGTLRVSAPTSFGASVIAPLTATFLQAWPAVRVELDLTNRMVDLVDEGFDLAIRIGEIHHEDLVARYLAPYRMGRRAGLSGALRNAREAGRSRRSSLPVPYGLDRPQRVAAAGRRGRSALETRCGFALQRWLRAAPGGDRRGRAADAAGGAAGRCAGQRQPGSGAGGVDSAAETRASALAPGSSAPAEADAVYRPPSAGNGRRADNDPRVGIITPSAAPAASRQSDRWDLRSPPTGGSAAV